MATQDDYVRITLRLPKELQERLNEATEESFRSMNAEIVARLEESFTPRTINNTTIRGNLVTADSQAIADQVERRLHGSDLEKLSVITSLLLAFPDAVAEAHRRSLLEIASRIVGCANDHPSPLATLSVALAKLKADVNYRSETSPLQSE